MRQWFFRIEEGAGMHAAYCHSPARTDSERVSVLTAHRVYSRITGWPGWWRGGGGPSTGTVIGGRPGSRRPSGRIPASRWQPGIAPGGGGGGGGGMPLEIWIVMIEPGTVVPVGGRPDHRAVRCGAVHRVAWSATWKPASFRRWRAVSCSCPRRSAPSTLALHRHSGDRSAAA